MDKQLLLLLVGALLLRVGMMLYGEYHDRHHVLKYTDIDYVIFSDAARHITNGASPYLRSTYRYTPLIALLLAPTVNVVSWGGKVTFIFFDLVVGVVLYRLGCLVALNISSTPGMIDRAAVKRTAAVCAAAWLLNPLVSNISTRGSADSVAMLPIVAFVVALWEWRPLAAGAWLAVAVHIRLFPVIFGPLAGAFLLFGGRPAESFATAASLNVRGRRTAAARPADPRLSWTGRVRAVLAFGVAFFGVVSVATAAGYYAYGYDFIFHSYTYHFTRADHRHNFSPYWLSTYIAQSMGQAVPVGIAKGVLLAQLIITSLLAFRLRAQPAVAIYAITHAFVTLNKVVTVQYFAWWLSLLPMALLSAQCLPLVDYGALAAASSLRTGWTAVIAALLSVVVVLIACWVRASYIVEMVGIPAWKDMFVASVTFTVANGALVAAVVGASYKAPPPAAVAAAAAEEKYASIEKAEDAMFARQDMSPVTTSASPTKPAQRATPLKRMRGIDE